MGEAKTDEGRATKDGGAPGMRWRFGEAARRRLAFLQPPARALRAAGKGGRAGGGKRGPDIDDHIRLAVREESAASLGRAGRRLREAVAALADFDCGRETASLAAAAARGPLLADAARALWECVVQREAVGITRHDLLDELYGVTPELWRLMGSADCVRGDAQRSG